MKRLPVFFGLILLIVASCSDSPSVEYQLSIISGNSQSTIQGHSLPKPIVIKITDANQNPQKGVEVAVAVFEGGGVIEGFNGLSDDQGLIRIQWKLGEEVIQKSRLSIVSVPSVNTELQAFTNYRYSIPPRDQDGWEVGPLDFLNSDTKDLLFKGIDRLRAGDYPEVHSVLLMHNRKLVLEEYYSGRNLDGELVDWDRFTPHTLQSASKSFRSMLVGIAIDKGIIENVDVPFYSFFPEHSDLNDDDLKDDITLEHVLTMSSGLDWEEWAYPKGHPKHNLSAMYAKPRSQWIPYVLGLPMRDVPGSRFTYNTGASLMLDDVVSNSLDEGTDLTKFAEDNFFSMVEEEGDYPYITTMTSRRMMKLGYVYHYDGKWKDNQIISTEWIEKSTRARFPLINSQDGGYGYQWWIRDFVTPEKTYRCFYASGNGGQFIVVNKELDLVVVFTGGNHGLDRMYNILNWMEDYVFTAFEN